MHTNKLLKSFLCVMWWTPAHLHLCVFLYDNLWVGLKCSQQYIHYCATADIRKTAALRNSETHSSRAIVTSARTSVCSRISGYVLQHYMTYEWIIWYLYIYDVLILSPTRQNDFNFLSSVSDTCETVFLLLNPHVVFQLFSPGKGFLFLVTKT